MKSEKSFWNGTTTGATIQKAFGCVFWQIRTIISNILKFQNFKTFSDITTNFRKNSEKVAEKSFFEKCRQINFYHVKHRALRRLPIKILLLLSDTPAGSLSILDRHSLCLKNVNEIQFILCAMAYDWLLAIQFINARRHMIGS